MMQIENIYFEELISGIPWERNPMIHAKENMAAYAAAIKLMTGDSRIVKQVPYDSPEWDLNLDGEPKTKENIYKLKDCPPELDDYIRFFIIHKFGKRKARSTTNLRVASVISVLGQIMAKNSAKSLCTIDIDDIIDEVSGRKAESSHRHTLYESLFQFYKYLEEDCALSLPIKLESLKGLGIAARKETQDHREEDKWPDIPAGYFNRILEMALKVMRDYMAPARHRTIAACIVLLSQLGLRLIDLLSLTVDSKHEEEAEGLTMYYLNYSVKKLSKPHAPMTRFDIFLSDLGLEAYNILMRMRQQHPECNNSNALILFPSGFGKRSKVSSCPTSKTTFYHAYNDFFYTYLWEDIHIPWHGIRHSVIYAYDSKDRINTREKVYIPDSPQFRVHLCTYLYNHGVKMTYVEEHLGHLSEMMYGYYNRSRDTRQESAMEAEKFIKNIVVDGMIPIGLHSEELKAKLDSFIKEKNLNVSNDMAAIMKELDPEVAIRAKTGGFCYKATFLACPEDPHTKKLLCAFNRCPNVYSFYYMADISYSKLRACEDAYYANLQRGLVNAARKEANNARDIIERTLAPQIKQLERELAIHGAKYIIERYPTMELIITNLKSIKHEIAEWKVK